MSVSETPALNWSDIWEIENTDDHGYGIMDHYEWYGVGLVVIATLGCMGNLFALCIFLHPNMRSPYGVYVCALLIVDIVYLIFHCLVQVPGAHLTKISVYDPKFWEYLSNGQNTFVMAYGIADLASSLVIWYTVALLGEQYCVIYKPNTTLRFSSTAEKAIKICITILNMTILVHLVHFFKLVLKPIDIEDYKRICLSDIYTNEAYRLYDVYIYFIFFGLSAWFTSVIFCFMISFAVITSRYNIGEVLPDQKIFRVFKNGRSIRTSLTVGFWYVICFAVADICYISTWFYEPWDSGEVDCHFRPADQRFKHTPSFLRILHDVFIVLNSSLRFPMIAAANSNFRRILTSCFAVRTEVMDTVSALLTTRPIANGNDYNGNHEYVNRAYIHPVKDYHYDHNGEKCSNRAYQNYKAHQQAYPDNTAYSLDHHAYRPKSEAQQANVSTWI